MFTSNSRSRDVLFGVSLRAWETASGADISITTFSRCSSADGRITTQLVCKKPCAGMFWANLRKSQNGELRRSRKVVGQLSPDNFLESLLSFGTPKEGQQTVLQRMGLARLWRPCCYLQQPVSRKCPRWTLRTRSFATCPVLESGHNRWSKIKHDKGKEDALKSKARSILSQEIYNASKCWLQPLLSTWSFTDSI